MYINNSPGYDYPAQSWNNCSDAPGSNEPFNNPELGLVYLTKWKITTPVANGSTNSKGCTVTERYTRHYYYIGNEYLYTHYIDQRIDSGMDGV